MGDAQMSAVSIAESLVTVVSTLPVRTASDLLVVSEDCQAELVTAQNGVKYYPFQLRQLFAPTLVCHRTLNSFH